MHGSPGALREKEGVRYVAISVTLDSDVPEHVRTRAGEPGAFLYQMRMYQLRYSASWRNSGRGPGSQLAVDERMIEAVTERARARR